MKKWIALLSAALLSTTGLPVLSAEATVYAAEQEYGGMKYEITDNAITITGRTDALPASLVIPSYIDGLPVTCIGDRAFSGCKTLTSVVIPDTVTEIGSTAFYATEALESITIPESVVQFGSTPFGESKWLTLQREIDPFVVVNHILIDGAACTGYVEIPSGITEIAQNAFSYSKEITGVTIPEGVTFIDNSAFYNCTALTELHLPDSLTKIGIFVWFGCSSLKSVTIPPNLTRISSASFRECTALQEIIIPPTVTRIDALAFYECADLTIFGDTGSAAETYAIKNDIPFSPLNAVSTTETTSTLPSVPLGNDLNGDGEFSIADAVLLARFVSEDKALTAKEITGILNAEPDQDADGRITIMDVNAILKTLSKS